MTRDEAIRAFATKMNRPQAEYYHETVQRVTPMIDGFAALGMLQLDASPNIPALIKEARRYSDPSKFVEISPSETAKLINIIKRLAAALESANVDT